MQKEKTIRAELAQVHKQIELAIEENNLLRDLNEAAADAFLAGKRVDVSSFDERLRKLQREADVISLALTKQQAITAELRGKFSRDVCDHSQNRRAYIEIEKRIATAVRELAIAGANEEEFFAELDRAGVTRIDYRPMRVKQIGTLRDDNSLASRCLKEFETYLPEALD